MVALNEPFETVNLVMQFSIWRSDRREGEDVRGAGARAVGLGSADDVAVLAIGQVGLERRVPVAVRVVDSDEPNLACEGTKMSPHIPTKSTLSRNTHHGRNQCAETEATSTCPTPRCPRRSGTQPYPR